jgi:hypothetical protein
VHYEKRNKYNRVYWPRCHGKLNVQKLTPKIKIGIIVNDLNKNKEKDLENHGANY